jgi:hypothetical protein
MPAFQRMSGEEISLASRPTCILYALFSIERDAKRAQRFPSHDDGHACETKTELHQLHLFVSSPDAIRFSCLPQTPKMTHRFTHFAQCSLPSFLSIYCIHHGGRPVPSLPYLLLLTLSTSVQSNGSPPCMDAMLLFDAGDATLWSLEVRERSTDEHPRYGGWPTIFIPSRTKSA